MKFCNSCGTSKALSAFNKKGAGFQPKCRDCQKAYYRNYYNKDNKERLRAVKSNRQRRDKARDKINRLKNRPCTDCGGTFPACAMDFDHTEDNKLFSVSSAISSNKSIKAIELEVSKCELVCANCHRVRTYNRLNP